MLERHGHAAGIGLVVGGGQVGQEGACAVELPVEVGLHVWSGGVVDVVVGALHLVQGGPYDDSAGAVVVEVAAAFFDPEHMPVVGFVIAPIANLHVGTVV